MFLELQALTLNVHVFIRRAFGPILVARSIQDWVFPRWDF
jgi:hypothetical protein